MHVIVPSMTSLSRYCTCRVINPCFDIHAIEVADAGSARDDVYSAVGSVMGPVADVYLSDSYVL